MIKPISITKPFLALGLIFLVTYYEAPLLFYLVIKKNFFFDYYLVTLYNLYKLLLVRFKI
jgi:hypothetical protein